jgi:pilus assembly protein FimV
MPRASVSPASGAENTQVDVSLVEMSASTFDRLMQSGSVHSAVRQSQQTVPLAVDKAAQATAVLPRRARIDADDIVDVRQRAEFFVTLGQTDQAVQVLEARIAQDKASCPQVYLDLFQLFHSLGLKADFDQLRDDFVRLFHARIPEFADFANEGRVLEDYPGTVDRLIRVWSRPNVLEVIEQMVYAGKADEGEDGAFDLAAFRDLLILHAVAHKVRMGAGGATGAVRAPMPVDDGAGNAVDIDLSELFSTEGAPTMVLPRINDGALADSGVDLPLDDAGPAPDAPSQAQSGNLIDFDLGDVDFLKKPQKDS